MDENGLVVSRGTSPRFVGRAVELALLEELLGKTRAGELVTVLICGEAGAGKTRLVDEVTAAARGQGTRLLVGSCAPIGRTSFAFAPFVEALRPVVRELTTGERRDSGRPVAPRLWPPTCAAPAQWYARETEC